MECLLSTRTANIWHIRSMWRTRIDVLFLCLLKKQVRMMLIYVPTHLNFYYFILFTFTFYHMKYFYISSPWTLNIWNSLNVNWRTDTKWLHSTFHHFSCNRPIFSPPHISSFLLNNEPKILCQKFELNDKSLLSKLLRQKHSPFFFPLSSNIALISYHRIRKLILQKKILKFNFGPRNACFSTEKN